ncbi:MAG: hypothetical protein IBX50_19270 [Marinospirillum sp.]|uniref:hypothetical protein n=1 Tax=Marinospirillum sp. TaxID=2183934 RepID=UPI001A065856|nr:hypothetical protein [Marinospirillum sp.]MBE0508831.1 hypothetical protein [Marinospirillum sp.]
MVLLSVESSSLSWSRQQTAAPGGVKKKAAQTAEQPHQEKTKPRQLNDVAAGESNSRTASLPDETFQLDEDSSHSHSYPDFTLSLKSQDNKGTTPEAFTHSEEARHGRKRPPLPFTFGFGIRRPMAIAVAMRQPIFGNESPLSAAQAIGETLDLAATNRLPYVRGSQLSLVA